MSTVRVTRIRWLPVTLACLCGLTAALSTLPLRAADAEPPSPFPAPGTEPKPAPAPPAPGTEPAPLPAPGTEPAPPPAPGTELAPLPAPGTEPKVEPPTGPSPTPPPAPRKVIDGPAAIARVANQMVVTHPVKTEALSMGGVASLLIPSGALYVLSRSPRAIIGKGVSKIQANVFGVAGGLQFEGLAKGTRNRQVQCPYPTDPLADLTPPTDAGLKVQTPIVAGPKEVLTIYPGIYDSIDLTGDAKVFMKPGRYVLKQGLTMQNHSSLIGDGVLIINLGTIKCDGFGQLTLSAPRQGPYTGLVLYQPPDNTQPVTTTSVVNLTGTVYLPAAQLHVGGVCKAVMGSVVADTVMVDGSNSLTIEGAPFYVPPAPAKKAPAGKKR